MTHTTSLPLLSVPDLVVLPGMVVPVTGAVPAPEQFDTLADREAAERALVYMALAVRHRFAGES